MDANLIIDLTSIARGNVADAESCRETLKEAADYLNPLNALLGNARYAFETGLPCPLTTPIEASPSVA